MKNEYSEFLKSGEDVPAEISLKLMNAIQKSLREEKESAGKRMLKITSATALCVFILGIPFLASFNDQLSSAWMIAFTLWTLLIFAGFTLHFRPEPRIMVRGVFSPFVIARLLLISSFTTVLQILICPSFVFLVSPLDWNPLGPLTHFLMATGGMNLCMLFCGFIFSLLSGALGVFSITKAVAGHDRATMFKVFCILLVSQVPILVVQILTPDLRNFVAFWAVGLLIGTAIIFVLLNLFSMHSLKRAILKLGQENK
jgi:hypothetical protein